MQKEIHSSAIKIAEVCFTHITVIYAKTNRM